MENYNNNDFKMQLIVTIGRQLGSGGRTVGKMLAKKLGIPYYDNEILHLASESSAIDESIFANNDEQVNPSSLLKILSGYKFKDGKPELGKNLTKPENLFKFQSEVIKELAKNESFVIIGRCANWVLQSEHKNKVLRIFFYADFDTRVERIMSQFSITKEQAIEKILESDKKREYYYKYFTGENLVDLHNYDMMLNTTTIGFPEILDIVEAFLKARGFI